MTWYPEVATWQGRYCPYCLRWMRPRQVCPLHENAPPADMPDWSFAPPVDKEAGR